MVQNRYAVSVKWFEGNLDGDISAISYEPKNEVVVLEMVAFWCFFLKRFDRILQTVLDLSKIFSVVWSEE